MSEMEAPRKEVADIEVREAGEVGGREGRGEEKFTEEEKAWEREERISNWNLSGRTNNRLLQTRIYRNL